MADGVDADLAGRAVAHFGVTDDPSECGYILPDGTMLDLSGRHWDGEYERRGGRNVRRRGHDYFAGTRLVDHRDLGDLVEGGGSEAMIAFMAASGAVRVKPGNGFTLVAPATPRQVAMMCLAAAHYGGDVEVDVYDLEGNVTATRHFDTLRPRPAVDFLREAGLYDPPPSPPSP